MHAEGYVEDVTAIFNMHLVSFFHYAKTADYREELLYETKKKNMQKKAFFAVVKHLPLFKLFPGVLH